MKAFALILFLFQSILGFGQYAIKGVVKDYSSSKTVKGVSIIVDTSYNTNYKNKSFLGGAVTNSNGEFEVSNITEKKVNLILYYLCYERLIMYNITLTKNATTDIGEIAILAGPLCAGFECKDGDIKRRRKRVGKEIKLRYPKKGNKIKVKIKENYILINYEDINYSRSSK